MFKVLDNHIGAVAEQLNLLEEEGNNVEVLSSQFVGDRYLKALVRVTPLKQTLAGQAKEPAVVKPAIKKAPAVKKS